MKKRRQARSPRGRFVGRTVFVSGAARGIGRAIAEALFAEGAQLIVCDRDPAVQGLAETFGKKRALASVTDVSDHDALGAAIARGADFFGGLHAAINNAGILGPTRLLALTDEAEFDRVLAVNLSGVFYALRHQLPRLVEAGGGAIVNVASVNGLRAAGHVSGYCAAKFGVVGLTRTAALEYGARGVRINALCPGAFATELFRAGGSEADVLRAAPLGRIGTLPEVADAALWLASEEASYVTGQTVVVDGGILAR